MTPKLVERMAKSGRPPPAAAIVAPSAVRSAFGPRPIALEAGGANIGAGPSAPAPAPSPAPSPAPPTARVASWDFRNSGATDPDNCCPHCPIALGVGVGTGFQNGMELAATIANHRGTVFYDIKRQMQFDVCSRTNGVWSVIAGGSGPDDSHNDDECLTPSGASDVIYVEDRPGFVNPGTPNPGETDLVVKATFTESVEITDVMGTRTDPTTFDWHSITWLTDTGGAWTVDAAQSEIEPGSMTIAPPP